MSLLLWVINTEIIDKVTCEVCIRQIFYSSRLEAGFIENRPYFCSSYSRY